jgi:isopenicillin N synthase-like dioxygenase
MSTATLPVLDFSQFAAGTARQQQAFVMDLGQALAEVGFFALDQSPVDPKLIQAAYEAAAAFFALPDAVKQRYERPELHGQRGFVPLGREHAKDYPVPDLKEFWHVGRDPHPGLPHLPANLWPEEVPQFQTTMQALYQQLDDCAAVLLEACALYLDHPRQLLRHQVQGGDTIFG